MAGQVERPGDVELVGQAPLAVERFGREGKRFLQLGPRQRAVRADRQIPSKPPRRLRHAARVADLEPPLTCVTHELGRPREVGPADAVGKGEVICRVRDLAFIPNLERVTARLGIGIDGEREIGAPVSDPTGRLVSAHQHERRQPLRRDRENALTPAPAFDEVAAELPETPEREDQTTSVFGVP